MPAPVETGYMKEILPEVSAREQNYSTGQLPQLLKMFSFISQNLTYNVKSKSELI